jgi:hypothetical protein
MARCGDWGFLRKLALLDFCTFGATATGMRKYLSDFKETTSSIIEGLGKPVYIFWNHSPVFGNSMVAIALDGPPKPGASRLSAVRLRRQTMPNDVNGRAWEPC